MALREKYPSTGDFLVAIFGDLQSKSPNPNQIRENKEQEKLRIISVYSPSTECTAQKIKFFINNFLSKYDKILSFLWIWSRLLKKSLIEKISFFVCSDGYILGYIL